MMDIAVYVDDLLIAARNPNEIVKVLQENHKFKLKGVGALTYHLGCDHFRERWYVVLWSKEIYLKDD
jgi:hypothetical protein